MLHGLASTTNQRRSHISHYQIGQTAPRQSRIGITCINKVDPVVKKVR
jgi:hypothetical protein